jgi:hypothetical protein
VNSIAIQKPGIIQNPKPFWNHAFLISDIEVCEQFIHKREAVSKLRGLTFAYCLVILRLFTSKIVVS